MTAAAAIAFGLVCDQGWSVALPTALFAMVLAWYVAMRQTEDHLEWQPSHDDTSGDRHQT